MTKHRTLNVLRSNLLLSRSDIRILASHLVAGMIALEPCPERTSEKHAVSNVLSGHSAIPAFPATAWLANFLRRFATIGWFLQSTLEPKPRAPKGSFLLCSMFDVP